MTLKSITRACVSTILGATLLAWPIAFGQQARPGDPAGEDPQPQPPPCYVTHSEGYCGPNRTVTVRCDNGAGIECVTLQEISGWHYTAGPAAGGVGYREVTMRNCSARTIRQRCVPHLGGASETCEVYENDYLLVAGAIATGDSCDSGAKRVAEQ